MRTAALIATALVAFSGSGCGEQRADQELLQGMWECEQRSGDLRFGLPPVKGKELLTFEGESFTAIARSTVSYPPVDDTVHGTFALDPAKKQIVFSWPEHKTVGIYRVSERLLELCISRDAREPPATMWPKDTDNFGCGSFRRPRR